MLFKEFKTHIRGEIQTEIDTGYQGIEKLHANSALPKKGTKKNPLTKDEKR